MLSLLCAKHCVRHHGFRGELGTAPGSAQQQRGKQMRIEVIMLNREREGHPVGLQRRESLNLPETLSCLLEELAAKLGVERQVQREQHVQRHRFRK